MSEQPDFKSIMRRLREQVQEELSLSAAVRAGNDPAPEQLRKEIERIVLDRTNYIDGLTEADKAELVEACIDDFLNYGPAQQLIDDPNITEIMINGAGQTYVEVSGELLPCAVTFDDAEDIKRVVNKILQPLNRRLDEQSPMVDARTRDGHRVNATIPPATPDGPTVTIRKFQNERLSAESLIELGTLDEDILEFLSSCVEARCNILISGGTGTGKTTMLNILSGFIPSGERIITCEDICELSLKKPHVVRLEARPPNTEGEGEITIKDLVRNTLRMRPDRIVVGEVRGDEAVDMLQAMNTGHDGSLSTIHANSPEGAYSRLETMVLGATELPSLAIKQQIASAIDIVVQITRLKGGVRRVTKVAAIDGMEGLAIRTQPLFEFIVDGHDEDKRAFGHHCACGFQPPASIQEKFAISGVDFNRSWFAQER